MQSYLQRFHQLIPESALQKLKPVALHVGYAYIAVKAYQLLGYLWRIQPIHFCSNKHIWNSFGLGSYAVVTGATDGIGKGFAFGLAKRGFNLVLVSRNEKKLQETKQQILNQYPGTKIVTIAVDFSNAADPKIFEAIKRETESLDVSVLVNNVGVDKCEPFSETSHKHNTLLVNVNNLTTVTMTQLFAEKINARPQKGSIIFTGSISGDIPAKYFAVYGATKAFILSFSRNIRNEYPDLKILLLSPGEVSTGLIFNKPAGKTVATVEECVEGTLKDVGVYEKTDGATRHKISNTIMRSMPYCVFSFLFKHFKGKKMLKERQAGEERHKLQNGGHSH